MKQRGKTLIITTTELVIWSNILKHRNARINTMKSAGMRSWITIETQFKMTKKASESVS